MVINLEVPAGAVDKYTVYSAAEGVLKRFPLSARIKFLIIKRIEEIGKHLFL